MALSRGALKNSGLRRGINVVWDIFGFWPHAAHPFGPEPYSRWTVMELTNRIRYHLGRRPGASTPAVVIGPHSQGSIITVAALLLLPRPTGLVVFVVLFGAGYGVMTIARAALLGTYVPQAVFGAVSGGQAMAAGAGRVWGCGRGAAGRGAGCACPPPPPPQAGGTNQPGPCCARAGVGARTWTSAGVRDRPTTTVAAKADRGMCRRV